MVGVIRRQSIKNTVITYAGITIGAVNMIFVQPRLLSEEELGLTRLMYFCAYLLGLAVPLGLPHIIVKYFPLVRNPEKRHYGFPGFVLIGLLAGFGLFSVLLLWLRPQITAYYSENSRLFVDYFLLLIPFTLIVSMVTVATTYCQSLFKSTVPAFLNDICVRIGVTVLTIAYFNQWLTLTGYVYTYIGIYLAELIALIVFIAVVDRISLVPSREIFLKISLRSMVRFGMVMCAAGFASYGLRTVDAILLGNASLAVVGVYTTAVFIASFIEVPLGALERISHTKVADYYARDDMKAIGTVYRESVAYLLAAGGFLFVGLNACVKYIYELGGLPSDYTECIDVVYIVGLGALVNVSTGVNTAILFYSRHYIAATLLMVATLAVTVALNLLLIPRYGIYGAAFSSLAGATLYNIAKFAAIYVNFRLQPYSRKSLLFVVVTLVCTMIAHLLPSLSFGPAFNILWKGGLSCSLYLALLIWLKIAPPEMVAVYNRLRRKKG